VTFICEVCGRSSLDAVRYVIHLDLAHPVGELARAVEPSLLGGVMEPRPEYTHRHADPDPWHKGGRSGLARRFHE